MTRVQNNWLVGLVLTVLIIACKLPAADGDSPLPGSKGLPQSTICVSEQDVPADVELVFITYEGIVLQTSVNGNLDHCVILLTDKVTTGAFHFRDHSDPDFGVYGYRPGRWNVVDNDNDGFSTKTDCDDNDPQIKQCDEDNTLPDPCGLDSVDCTDEL